jgi:hypothetical protein
MHKNGFNFFFLFPKEEKLLIINNILIPPAVFVEYNGFVFFYELDFENQKGVLSKLQFGTKENPASKYLRGYKKEHFNNIILRSNKIVNQEFKRFALMYAEYLKGEF